MAFSNRWLVSGAAGRTWRRAQRRRAPGNRLHVAPDGRKKRGSSMEWIVKTENEPKVRTPIAGRFE
jgi:hypothetical protein